VPLANRAVLTRADTEAWIAAYERAWRTAGTEPLRELFSEDASYRMSPYEEPVTGLAAIAELWEREREGPDELFEMSHEIVAVEGDTAVVRVEVEYEGPRRTEYRDLWIVRFDSDGRCREFEEWPFWPGQPFVARGGDR
jgi:ketosteroid isomerase-like protein